MHGIARSRASSVAAPASNQWVCAVDRFAYRSFVGCLVLAFTTAIPDQFALPKLLGVSVYAAVAVGLWIVALRQGRVGRLPPALIPIVAATVLWWTTTTATARHVATALLGMPGRHDGLATMLGGLVLFLTLATTRSSDREVEGRLGAIAIAMTAASAYALLQAAGLDPIPWPPGRPASTFGHPVVFGGALALCLPLSAVFALEGRSRAGRAAWGGAALVQALALVLTLARGPWIAAVVGLAVFALLRARSSGRGAARTTGRLLVAGLLLVAVLSAWASARHAVLDRLSTLGRPADDSSLAYRAHFAGAAIAMLRDHPLFGVGWENFGLLYFRYRSPPTERIAADLVPTMVHCGPLQTAVSGGIPALALHAAFFAAVLAAVARRRRSETAPRSRRVGDALLASGVAYVLQDLSGWPHVALGTLAFVLAGLAVSWASARGPRAVVADRWPLVALAGAAVVAAAVWSVANARLFRAHRMLFEADQLSADRDWADAEPEILGALEIAPDRAWALDAASRLYLRRAADVPDRRAYERGVRLAAAANAANPWDPYLPLRRAELDLVAMDGGLLTTLTEEARDALLEAESAAPGSVRVALVEASLERKSGGSRIVWIAPSSAAGFGPPESLIAAGTAARALPGTSITLHWRDLTRGSRWRADEGGVPLDREGHWYAAIPQANARHRYALYATSQTWRSGPCASSPAGAIAFCAPISLIEADPTGTHPRGSVLVAGAAPPPGTELVLRWKNASRDSGWISTASRAGASDGAIAFPPDAPGTWAAFLRPSPPGEPYRIAVSMGGAVATCSQPDDGGQALCAPLSMIAPAAAAGFGPPGGLVVGGYLPQGVPGTPVFLHWRDATRGSTWVTEAAAPSPDARGVWYNSIRDVRPGDRYEFLVTSPTTATPTCVYEGRESRSECR